MGVEVARDCLATRDRLSIAQVVLAPTSHSFADRAVVIVGREGA